MDRTELNNWIIRNGLTAGNDGQVFYTSPAGDDARQYYFCIERSGKYLILAGGIQLSLSSISRMKINSTTFDLLVQAGSIRYNVACQEIPILPQGPETTSYKKCPMPKTDSELNDIFPELYPGYQEKLIYDVLREREMVDLSILDPTKEPGEFVDFNENIEYRFYDSIERRLKDLGCNGTPPSTAVRFRVLFTKFHEHEKNTFLDWVKSISWDGVCRVDTWFQRVFNASVAIFNNPEMEKLYLARVARAWFVGAISRSMKETVHEIVPVLIGKQGCGKTSGLRYTAGKSEWFIDTIADVTTQQAVIRFLDSVRGKIVVEMAESTQIRSKDQKTLKAFISKSSDQYRKPYARRDDDFPRHFILAASSNLDDVFTDVTGNRRYYPIYCGPAQFENRTQYDVEQVWAEAYEMYKQGEVCRIREEWYPAKLTQHQATQDNNNIAIIDDWLDDPNNGFSLPGSKVCEKQIYKLMFGYGDVELIRPEHKVAVRAWKNGSRNWAPCTPIKYNGKSERAVERIHYPGENTNELLTPKLTQDELLKISIETSDMIPWSSESRPLLDKFCDFCKEAMYEGSVVSPERFTKEELERLVDDGCVYKDKNQYRILKIPEKIKSEISDD